MDPPSTLLQIRKQLSRQFEKVDVRGQGAASFLYLVHNGRTVEISEHNGGFWLELWERSDDETADSFKELTVSTPEGAIHEAQNWLLACD